MGNRLKLQNPVACLLLSLATLFCGCSKAKQDVTVFLSGDTAGWITPCGCTSNQSGGLSRRATLIQDAKASGATVVLDVGGAVAGKSEYDFLKLQSILTGQKQMGLDAFNLGGPECQFTAKQLIKLGADLKIPFVSANVCDKDGKLIADAVRLIEQGDQRIAITGVVDPDLVGDDLTATDPYRSAFEVVKELEADRIIVLAYMDEAKLKSLAKKLTNADAVLGGPTGQVVPPTTIGRVLVSSSTNKGKFILKMNLPADGNASANIVEVSSDLKESEAQKQNLEDFYKRLGQADFSPQQTQFVSSRLLGAASQKIAGNESCLKCHKQDDSVWHNSKHSHAWASLKTTGAQVDPACQRCHTTGYGVSGGFQRVSTSPTLTNVGCETCHGPSHEHAVEPTIRTPFVAKEQCISCHDHENSPNFKYTEYWTKIVHGLEKSESL